MVAAAKHNWYFKSFDGYLAAQSAYVGIAARRNKFDPSAAHAAAFWHTGDAAARDAAALLLQGLPVGPGWRRTS